MLIQARMSLEFRTLQPEEFYRQHIEAGVRPDGRQLGERRAMAVSAGNISTVTSSLKGYSANNAADI